MQWSPGEGAERRYWVEGHGQALPLPFLSSDPAPLLGSPGLLGLPVMEGHGLWWLDWEGLLAITGCSFLLPTVTPSDCYVTLWLPTASSDRLRTRTVRNSRNPIWNQSFRFQIHSQVKVGQVSAPALLTLCVHCHCHLRAPHSLPLCFSPSYSTPPSCTLFPFQNVLQLQVFDQDLLTSDDPVLSVLFDVGTLRVGEFRSESFTLNPQARLHPGPGRASALRKGGAWEGGRAHGALFSSGWSRLPWHLGGFFQP